MSKKNSKKSTDSGYSDKKNPVNPAGEINPKNQTRDEIKNQNPESKKTK